MSGYVPLMLFGCVSELAWLARSLAQNHPVLVCGVTGSGKGEGISRAGLMVEV